MNEIEKVRSEHPWLRMVEGVHRALPVVIGNEIHEVSGVTRSYLREHHYDPPTALTPEDHVAYTNTHHPAVTIGMGGRQMNYVMNLHRDAARDLYKKLHEIFG